ncbi:MAG TPA: hypothetical protein VMU28_10925 [Terriglobales bacterium]|nr:hypothetical protein [Terriglobales bacterium]
MRKFFIVAMVAVALLATAKDKSNETIDQLRVRAAAADKRKQTDLYAELAKRELEEADSTYNTDAEKAKALFNQSAKDAEVASQAAIDANHRLKQTEISLRELEHRMSDMRRSWAFDDRAGLDPAIQRVEAARTKLLDRMFQK